MDSKSVSIHVSPIASLLILCFAVVLTSPQLQAQGFGGRGGGFGGRGGGDRAARFERFLTNLDRNENGKVDPEEVTDPRTRSFLERAGADPSKSFKIKKFLKNFENNDSKPKKEASSSSQSMPGFAVEQKEEHSLGFAVSESERTTPSGEAKEEFSESANRQADRALRNYDRNEDGRLDADEIKKARWSYPPPEQNDINKDGSLSRAELLRRYRDREQASSSQSSSQSNSSRSQDYWRSRSQGPPGREGRPGGGGGGGGDRRGPFSGGGGGDRRGPYSGGGGDRRGGGRGGWGNWTRDSDDDSSDQSSSSSSENSEPKSKSKPKPVVEKDENEIREGYQSFVTGVFNTYDKDKDGKLSSDEVEKMRRKPSSDADTDKDGSISHDELVESYVVKAKNSSSSRRSRYKSSSTGSRRSSKSSNGKSAGAQPRNPLSKLDKNENGQIEMGEFTSDWNEDKVKEFYSKDTNRDGIITRSEWESK